ncbi:MAG: hypothetical protein U1E78_11690 [Gammaproteobacteria bacterium]
MAEYSYIGKGKVFLARRGDQRLRFVGNSDKVELSFTEETKELKDFTQAGGGIANSLSRIDKVEVALNLFDYSPENLSLAVFGEANVRAAGNVTNEPHTLFKNNLTRFQNSHISNIGVTDDISNIVYQQGIDYEILNSGIFVLATGSILDNTAVTVDYQYGATNVIQALVNSGNEYRFVFDGLNEAQSGKKVVLEVHRVKFTPAATLSFLGDEFGSIEMTGTALSDNTKTGAGISRFFKVEMEQ